MTRRTTILWTLVALLLVVNVGLAWFVARGGDEPLVSPRAGRSEKLILAVDAGDGRVLAADDANRLLLFVDGAIVRQTQLDALIGGIAVAPDAADTFFAGLSSGRVITLDGDLNPIAEFQVEGRVVGLEALTGGGVVVAHGHGGFSGRFTLTWHGSVASDPLRTRPLEFTVTGLELSGTTAIYGTLNARVSTIDVAGEGAPGWTVRLNQPVTRLAALPDGRILAGGDGGLLTLIGADGAIVTETALGEYPLRALAYDPATRTIVAGDAHGQLFVLDDMARLLVSSQVADADVEAVVRRSDSTMVVVPRHGPWQTLHPDAVDATRSTNELRRAQYGAAILLVTATIAAVIVASDRLRVPTVRWLRRVGRARLAYLFLLPGLGLVVLFSYYPAGLAFSYSLTNFSLRHPTEFVGLQNYDDVLTSDRYFRTGTVNLILIVVTSVLKTITVPLLVAELVFWLRNSVHRYIFRTLFVLPAVVPDLVFTLMWRQVYDPYSGLLNQLLRVVGLGRWERAWLGDEQTALWAVIGVGFPFVSAFSFLILLGGLLTINRDYFDAARVDGASRWARFRHIDLPLLIPQLRILLFFAVSGAVQGFAAIFVLTRGGPGTATYIPALQMYRRIGEGDFGYASAIGVVLFVIVLALTLFVLRFRRQEAIEAA